MGGSPEVSLLPVEEGVLGSRGRQHNRHQAVPLQEHLWAIWLLCRALAAQLPLRLRCWDPQRGRILAGAHSEMLVFTPIKWANADALAAVGSWE